MAEGLVGYDAAGPFRMTVQSLERQRNLTVLRMEVINTAQTSIPGHFGYDGLRGQSVSFGRFRLLDPVGRKVYFTLREKTAEGPAFGSRHPTPTSRFPQDFRPGVRYPVEVYFPPLPPEVKAVSIVPDMPMPPMTGIPVREGGTPPMARSADPYVESSPGTSYRLAVVPPAGEIWSGVSDLHELVETPQRSTRQEGGQEIVALRTDVLFAFDKAKLSKVSTAVLDDAVAETRAHADPAKPPIIIKGHTDSKGDDRYNLELSVKRAEAVRDYLVRKLGSGYVYRAEGKGESEPIARNEKKDGSDNPEGRAKNRRVEISYHIRQQRPDDVTTTAPADDVRGSTRPPAPFQADPGPVAGSLNWQRGNDRLRVDFHPFRRDGAYLVAAFDVRFDGSALFIPVPAPFTGYDNAFSSASDYGAFILVDPATKARYHPLKMYTEFVENYVSVLDPGESGRGYVYYPAPADSVTSITLEAEGSGKVENIPIL
ncbi:hypothetical protein Sru01_61030 [Sphaerisporangium rufum]|uniref:OmpA-like domain-containing protein n=1 Tax=Sphaerisporangium rufum TaxID=1381558 RepID=A0A919R9X9_9ACTN|nr:hypothetical protein Sru01_61030 [Sphaerisporangium rufum]